MRWTTITSGRVSLWLTTLLQLLFVLQAGKCCSCSHLFCGLCVITSFDHRAALLTGKYPQRVGLAGEEGTPRWIFLSLLSLYVVLFFFIVINCQGGYVCSGKGRLAVRYSNICLFGKVISQRPISKIPFLCQLCYHRLTWCRLELQVVIKHHNKGVQT